MTTLSQLETVREKIDGLEAEILNTKEALAAAQRTTEIEFLREQLLQLNNKQNLLQEEKNISLKSQVSGEHCMSSYQLLSLSCVAHTLTSCVMYQTILSSVHFIHIKCSALAQAYKAIYV